MFLQMYLRRQKMLTHHCSALSSWQIFCIDMLCVSHDKRCWHTTAVHWVGDRFSAWMCCVSHMTKDVCIPLQHTEFVTDFLPWYTIYLGWQKMLIHHCNTLSSWQIFCMDRVRDIFTVVARCVSDDRCSCSGVSHNSASLHKKKTQTKTHT